MANKQPESHYKLDKLHVIFAVASLVLLLTLTALFFNDYDREWKDYQHEFRSLEIEKTRVKYDAAITQAEKDSAYQTLQAELGDAQKVYDAQCAQSTDLDQEIQKLSTESELIGQQLKFANAELDAGRFRLEEAGAHHADHVKAARQEFEKLRKKARDLKARSEALSFYWYVTIN